MTKTIKSIIKTDKGHVSVAAEQDTLPQWNSTTRLFPPLTDTLSPFTRSHFMCLGSWRAIQSASVNTSKKHLRQIETHSSQMLKGASVKASV